MEVTLEDIKKKAEQVRGENVIEVKDEIKEEAEHYEQSHVQSQLSTSVMLEDLKDQIDLTNLDSHDFLKEFLGPVDGSSSSPGPSTSSCSETSTSSSSRP
ncbi:uncharacterized protein [Diabrotica undecimpunctata]|uniref:uncharacterized protein isoform X2 n=1 Tax=Diabrotica undecimpunctata TaxID=50387 RepID=UPI003B63A029